MRIIRTTERDEKRETEIDLAEALDEITDSDEFANESREAITSKLLRGDKLFANWMTYEARS